jgi:toxin-antitoxin system PIN domain toxin
MPASTTSFLFPDINVWIALTFDGHVHHFIAAKWFDSLALDSRLFFCRFTQLGLLRLLTAEAVMGHNDVLNQSQAWQAYDTWLEDDRISFLDEPPGVERAFRGLSRHRRPAPKDWADSYLSAFATASQMSVVTFDRALGRKATSSLVLSP